MSTSGSSDRSTRMSARVRTNQQPPQESPEKENSRVGSKLNNLYEYTPPDLGDQHQVQGNEDNSVDSSLVETLRTSARKRKDTQLTVANNTDNISFGSSIRFGGSPYKRIYKTVHAKDDSVAIKIALQDSNNVLEKALRSSDKLVQHLRHQKDKDAASKKMLLKQHSHELDILQSLLCQAKQEKESEAYLRSSLQIKLNEAEATVMSQQKEIRELKVDLHKKQRQQNEALSNERADRQRYSVKSNAETRELKNSVDILRQELHNERTAWTLERCNFEKIISKNETTISSLEMELDNAQNEVNDLKISRDQAHSRCSDALHELSLVQSLCDQAEAQHHDATLECERLNGLLADYKERLDRQSKTAAATEGELREKIETMRQDMQSLRVSAMDANSTSVEEMRRGHEIRQSLIDDLTKCNARVAELEKENKELWQQTLQQDTFLNTSIEDSVDLGRKVMDCDATLAHFEESKKNEWREEMTAHSEAVSSVSKSHEKTIIIERYAKENKVLQAEVKELVLVKNSLEREKSDFHNDMKRTYDEIASMESRLKVLVEENGKLKQQNSAPDTSFRSFSSSDLQSIISLEPLKNKDIDESNSSRRLRSDSGLHATGKLERLEQLIYTIKNTQTNSSKPFERVMFPIQALLGCLASIQEESEEMVAYTSTVATASLLRQMRHRKLAVDRAKSQSITESVDSADVSATNRKHEESSKKKCSEKNSNLFGPKTAEQSICNNGLENEDILLELDSVKECYEMEMKRTTDLRSQLSVEVTECQNIKVELQNKSEELQSLEKQRDREVTALRSEADQYNDEIVKLHHELQSTSSELQTVKEQRDRETASLKDSLSEAQRTHVSSDEEVARLHRELHSEREEHKAVNASRDQEMASLHAQLRDMQSNYNMEVEQRRSMVTKHESELETVRARAERELEMLRSSLVETQQDNSSQVVVAQLQRELQSKKEELASLRSALSEAQRTHVSSDEEVARLHRELQSTSSELQTAKEQRDRETASLKDALSEAQRTHVSSDEEVARLHRELQSTSSELQTVKEQRDRETASLKDSLSEAQRTHVSSDEEVARLHRELHSEREEHKAVNASRDQEVASLHAQLRDMQSNYNMEVEQRRSMVTKHESELETVRARAERELEMLRSSLVETQQDNSSQVVVAQLQRELQSKKEELASLRSALSEAQRTHVSSDEEVARLHRELHSEREEHKAVNASRDQEVASLHAQLRDMQSNYNLEVEQRRSMVTKHESELRELEMLRSSLVETQQDNSSQVVVAQLQRELQSKKEELASLRSALSEAQRTHVSSDEEVARLHRELHSEREEHKAVNASRDQEVASLHAQLRDMQSNYNLEVEQRRSMVTKHESELRELEMLRSSLVETQQDNSSQVVVAQLQRELQSKKEELASLRSALSEAQRTHVSSDEEVARLHRELHSEREEHKAVNASRDQEMASLHAQLRDMQSNYNLEESSSKYCGVKVGSGDEVQFREDNDESFLGSRAQALHTDYSVGAFSNVVKRIKAALEFNTPQHVCQENKAALDQLQDMHDTEVSQRIRISNELLEESLSSARRSENAMITIQMLRGTIKELREEAAEYRRQLAAIESRCEEFRNQCDSIPSSLLVASAELRVLKAKMLECENFCHTKISAEHQKASERISELESFMRKHEMEKKQLLDRINDQAMTIHHLTHNIRLIQRAGTYQGEGASETHAGKNASTQLNSTIRSEHPEYLASDNREVKNHKASSNSFSMHEDHAGDDTRQDLYEVVNNGPQLGGDKAATLERWPAEDKRISNSMHPRPRHAYLTPTYSNAYTPLRGQQDKVWR